MINVWFWFKHVLELLLTQNNPFELKIRSYFNILHTFLVRLKMCALFSRLGKIDRVSHFCPMNTQIKKCINIFHCSWKPPSRALSWIHNILFLLNIKFEQSTKLVFYLSIWTIYNIFSEYQQDLIQLMLTFDGINVCYYVYIFWSHFSKMILTTE